MIATIVPLVVVLAGAMANSLQELDLNTLKCDPTGETFLLLPHFTDCSKFFMCTHGKEVEFTCSDGTAFDFYHQTCNWIGQFECVLRPAPEKDDSSSSSSEEDDSSSSSSEEVEGSGEGDSWYQPTSGSVATALSTMDCHHFETASKQVPYSGDCQRYWRCLAGVPQAATCSDGLFFNAKTQQCDFEANVRCSEQNNELESEFIVYK